MSVHLLNARPLPSQFAGEWWVPASYAEKLEDALREDMREKSSLRGYMAEINKLWKNIPEKFEKAPWAKSSDAFRKFGLIKTGFCDVSIDCFANQEDAIRAAARIGYMARMAHGFAITRAKGDTVECITPHSQSLKAMGKEQFNKSKADVLDYCRGIVGVTE